MGAVIAAASVLTATVPDDAYIYFRYADHLAEGHGWRYNLIGDSGNAATSPLYTMLLAAIHWTGVPLLAAARAVSAVSMWTTMIFGCLIFRRLGRPLAAWPFAAIVVTAPLGVPVGMETLLYVTLAMGALRVPAEAGGPAGHHAGDGRCRTARGCASRRRTGLVRVA